MLANLHNRYIYSLHNISTRGQQAPMQKTKPASRARRQSAKPTTVCSSKTAGPHKITIMCKCMWFISKGACCRVCKRNEAIAVGVCRFQTDPGLKWSWQTRCHIICQLSESKPGPSPLLPLTLALMLLSSSHACAAAVVISKWCCQLQENLGYSAALRSCEWCCCRPRLNAKV